MQTNDNRFDDLLNRKVTTCAYRKMPHERKMKFGELHTKFNTVCSREDWDSEKARNLRDVILKLANMHVWAGVEEKQRCSMIRPIEEELANTLKDYGDL